MATRNNSANLSLLISRSAANTVFRDAVRLFVGRGKRYTTKQVEIGTGIAARMIESFMAPVDSTDFRKPDFEEVLSLASFFGSEFTSELIAPAQQAAFDLSDDDLPPGQIAADNADDNAAITRAALDGKFESHEAPDLRVVGIRMVGRGQRLASIGRAAA
jgi:hypothetical protein